MTATTIERDAEFAGMAPARVSAYLAASAVLLQGTIVCYDSAGRFVAGSGSAAYDAVGVAPASFDATGQAADIVEGEANCGIHGLEYTGTPLPGDVVYILDNQTVTIDSNGGTRGIAGVVHEVRNSLCYVWMGPPIVGMVRAANTPGFLQIPLGSLRIASSGAAVAAFNDGVADGFELTDSEALGVRFNPSSVAALAISTPMPQDLDDSQDVVLHLLGFRVGGDDITAAVTVGAFFQTVGAAHTADADAGGDTSAFDQATTIVTEVTRTIAAANVPASPSNLTLTLVPTAALDADDLVLLDAWIEYARK